MSLNNIQQQQVQQQEHQLKEDESVLIPLQREINYTIQRRNEHLPVLLSHVKNLLFWGSIREAGGGVPTQLYDYHLAGVNIFRNNFLRETLQTGCEDYDARISYLSLVFTKRLTLMEARALRLLAGESDLPYRIVTRSESLLTTMLRDIEFECRILNVSPNLESPD